VKTGGARLGLRPCTPGQKILNSSSSTHAEIAGPKPRNWREGMSIKPTLEFKDLEETTTKRELSYV
jgi:hypothetical protein